ncbi:alkaline phosphatase family protein [Flavihumibacter rivuli]|uniref:alkaline phosphatase family protein n=1 Tax=Flavihumibacter rivuli TaxID=2838156 RepID=UPI001BDF1EBF|nr:alkaline phosphatase family protein [Flavihumibacter rivuli]ULQ55521.1 alkaline phosphatase family protein [Flavihumibacter rivuli]
MKPLLKGLLLLTGWISVNQQANAQKKIENLILVTTDGLRWQEVFTGMDSALANDKSFNQGDSAGIYARYWDADPRQRRQKLMPFFWSVIAQKGQLYGNRQLGTKVNNANPHWFSYPGYSELLTGYGDEQINSNSFPPNPHTTLLEFLNRQPAYKNKVAVFGAWEAFDRIVNEKRSGIPVINAFDTVAGPKLSAAQQTINRMLLDSYRPFGNGECLDVFTHYAAMEHMKLQAPRVCFIAYGETDEWAHEGHYRDYLHAAHQVDKWIGDLWNWVQSDPRYRNKTAILITTDHGRGDAVKQEWTSHGSKIKGASETWFALLAPNLKAKGEVTKDMQVYQQQLAQTMARLLGLKYEASHPIAPLVDAVWE